jgi:hypothetical protein
MKKTFITADIRGKPNPEFKKKVDEFIEKCTEYFSNKYKIETDNSNKEYEDLRKYEK